MCSTELLGFIPKRVKVIVIAGGDANAADAAATTNAWQSDRKSDGHLMDKFIWFA